MFSRSEHAFPSDLELAYAPGASTEFVWLSFDECTVGTSPAYNKHVARYLTAPSEIILELGSYKPRTYRLPSRSAYGDLRFLQALHGSEPVQVEGGSWAPRMNSSIT
jgi:hypothetical protein